MAWTIIEIMDNENKIMAWKASAMKKRNGVSISDNGENGGHKHGINKDVISNSIIIIKGCSYQ